MPDLNRLILSTIGLLVTSTIANAGQSVWDHNGSQMLLQSDGSQRTISYLLPRPGLGVRPGDILFQGRRVGNFYEGTAYSFQAGCQPASFAVRGALGSETKIIVTGTPPKWSGCKIIGYDQYGHGSQLVFIYLKKYTGQISQPIPQLQDEGPREGPVQKIVKNIPGGKITIRYQDEDAPAETPIRVDITAQCVNGRKVTVLKNHRTCEFLGVRSLKDGSGFDLQELKFGGGTCSIGDTSRIQTYDLCQ